MLSWDFLRTLNHRTAPIEHARRAATPVFRMRKPFDILEHARRAATPVFRMRKPFDILAEGLLSENSRGDWI
jgi:hypothetical protein